MISVDITCDLHDRDETGFIWTYLDEAREPSLIEPGAIVMASPMSLPSPRWWLSQTAPLDPLFTSASCLAPSTTTFSLPSGRLLLKGRQICIDQQWPRWDSIRRHSSARKSTRARRSCSERGRVAVRSSEGCIRRSPP